jgi:hypothetical protein
MPGTRMAWMWSQQSDDATRICRRRNSSVALKSMAPISASGEGGRSGMVTVDTGLALSNALAGSHEPTTLVAVGETGIAPTPGRLRPAELSPRILR